MNKLRKDRENAKAAKKGLKRKARAIDSRKKVLLRREEIRKPARQQAEAWKKLKRVKKLKKRIGELANWDNQVFMEMDSEKLNKLEHNAQILKALEEEYQQEHDKKQSLNQELEEAGCDNLEAKLRHLHNKLADANQNMFEDLPLVEEKKPKDVAEVDVIRAK